MALAAHVAETIVSDLDAVALRHDEEVLVVGPVVGRAHRHPVPHPRQPLGQSVRDDVRRVEEGPLPQLADAAPPGVGSQGLPPEMRLVQPGLGKVSVYALEKTLGAGEGTPALSTWAAARFSRTLRAASSKPSNTTGAKTMYSGRGLLLTCFSKITALPSFAIRFRPSFSCSRLRGA